MRSQCCDAPMVQYIKDWNNDYYECTKCKNLLAKPLEKSFSFECPCCNKSLGSDKIIYTSKGCWKYFTCDTCVATYCDFKKEERLSAPPNQLNHGL